jgi:glycerophosphoryl diester phosphodiesterase
MSRSSTPRRPGPPLVIAHRGASGYLPEHSFPAKTYAHAVGADYLEQDVILTRDDVPVVFHDLTLEEVTDVARLFPARRRPDGHWYAIDFSYAELGRLSLHDRIEAASGKPAWPRRFGEQLPLRIHSLAEELALIRGLNRSTGRHTGVYTEVKSPAWHRQAGKELMPIVLGVLADFGYHSDRDQLWLSCFDDAELRRTRFELGSGLRLVQLIGENQWHEAATDYERLRSAAGLAEVARYAQAIGPWLPQVVTWPAPGAAPTVMPLARQAHAAGLAVYPYTFRIDQLPDNSPDADAAQHALFELAEIDGLFTDFPDVTLEFLRRRSLRP